MPLERATHCSPGGPAVCVTRPNTSCVITVDVNAPLTSVVMMVVQPSGL